MKVLVLCGGSGTRLWPVSREQFPKQFIQTANGKSLLANTFLRALALPAVTEIITVTNKNYFFFTADEYKNLNTSVSNTYFLEPIGRNTAAPIALAALYALSQQQDDEILVLPSDHLIDDLEEFSAKVEAALPLVNDDYVVTFGIKPSLPKTGYGYIKSGKKLSDVAFVADSFVEKPALEIAIKLLEAGDHYWNSGMFFFKASTIIEAFKQVAPELFTMIEKLWCQLQNNDVLGDQVYTLPEEAFSALTNISIDYAIMEKINNKAIVPVDFAWNDVGCWSEFSKLLEQDSNGNKLQGEALLIDVKNTLIRTDDKLVAAIGVDDLVIINTKDALLISKNDRVQDVKEIVNLLKEKNHDSYKHHVSVKRPWGEYTVLEEGANFKIKRIVVNPGASLSLQYHHQRSEHWVVVSGVANVINGDEEIFLQVSESTFIPKGAQHRLSNAGKELLAIIEVQVGDYLGEDDIVRLEDRYGRVV